jgi:hypothetical protein
MRAFSQRGDELVLGFADVGADVEEAVRALGFVQRGMVFVRSFPGDAPFAARAAERFEEHAAGLVRQAAGLEPVEWEAALEVLLDRSEDWWLTGSAALAVRGLAVAPRDIDLIATADACPRLAEALADLLVEPLVDGAPLGAAWFRAFAGARVECVGGVHTDHDQSDFGADAAARLETIEWRGRAVRVPPLELQLAASERRGFAARAALIREALA